ncbi:MAG: DUF4397 domain-containing protein [Chloroflexota bacterium]|nr:DUF4397 domain-containing protein [Chloroflexota bacterium]
MRRAMFVLGLLVAILTVSGLSLAQEAEIAHVRFVHAGAELNTATLFINDQITEVQNVPYRTVSDWYSLRADNVYNFSVGLGGGDANFQVNKRLIAGEWITLQLNPAAGTGRPTLTATNTPARVRVAHLAQGTGAVDVFINEELTDITALSFGSITPLIELPVGVTQLSVGATGDSPSLNVSANLRAGTENTIVAVGSPDGNRVQLRVISEDYGVLDANFARVTVLHAIPGLLPVNVVVNEGTFIQNLAFPGTLGNNDGVDAFETPAGTYDLQVVSTVDPSVEYFDVPDVLLAGNRAYFIAAYGIPGNAQLLVTNVDAADLP